MRLRYLHLPDYGPLQNVAVVFGQNSHITDRKGGINFVVGLNGSGKSSVLRSIFEVFHSLSMEKLPKFPVTLAYDISQSGERRTVLFHRPQGPRSKSFLVPTKNSVGLSTAEQWQSFVQEHSEQIENLSDQSEYVAGDKLQGSGILRNWLPSRVLAYTSGDETPWLEKTVQSFPQDELKDDPEEFVRENERPFGWTMNDEKRDVRTHRSRAPSDEITQEREKASDFIEDRCILIRPSDIRTAAVAVGIWQAAKELKDRSESYKREAFRAELLRQMEATTVGSEIEPARRLLNELDWLWPTHASFHFGQRTDKAAHHNSALCYWLHALSDTCVRQPLGESLSVVSLGSRPPVSPEDVAGEKLDEDLLKIAGESIRGSTSGAEALCSLFDSKGKPDETLWNVFKTLREWRELGLLKEVLLTIKRVRQVDFTGPETGDSDPDDQVLSYDFFSDGEQMLLGRMSLLLLLRKQPNSLLLLDEPETHFNDAWKRQIIDMVDDSILRDTSAQVIVATHTSLALTDVFSTEITRLTKTQGVTQSSPVTHPTFGADPGRILLHIFGAPDVIGARAAEFLREKLDPKKWPPEDREKLSALIDEIGSGWPRAKLMEILDKLDETDAPSDS